MEKLKAYLEVLTSKMFGKKSARKLRRLWLSDSKRDELRKWREFWNNFLSPGDLYFDIGSNYGQKIESLADTGIRILAVEPQQECFAFLQEKYGDLGVFLQKGVGAVNGKELFHISTAHPLSSFSREWIAAVSESKRFTDADWHQSMEIDIITLDNLCNQFGTPDFIKIDVEGYELQVLNGLNTPVKALCFEYTVPERLETLKSCLMRVADIYNGNVRFNFMMGDEVRWGFDEWKSTEQMLHEVENPTFINSSAGDIYARYSED